MNFAPLSRRIVFRRFPFLPIIALMITLFCASSAHSGRPHLLPEEIEWTWAVRPPDPDPKLPNVLLLGDSISRGYFPQVTKDLAGTANVYLMASSTSIGDRLLPAQIGAFGAMQGARFQVIHLNNGMHGWVYAEAQYEAGFHDYLKAVRKLLDHGGKLVWASITPVQADTPKGASNARIDARNAIASKIVQADKIPIDDQHSLMLNHQDLHADAVHYTPAGEALQGDQAAESIRAALEQSK